MKKRHYFVIQAFLRMKTLENEKNFEEIPEEKLRDVTGGTPNGGTCNMANADCSSFPCGEGTPRFVESLCECLCTDGYGVPIPPPIVQ